MNQFGNFLFLLLQIKILISTPQVFRKETCVFGFLSFSSTVAVFLLTLNVTTFLDHQKVLGIQTTQAQEAPPAFDGQKSYWEDIVARHPSYRDGYLELAQIALDDGDKKEAEVLILRAQQVDPNSLLVEEFLQKLQ